MRNFATPIQLYAIAKQRNVVLFSDRMQIASDDGKFFTRVLKSALVKKVGYRYPSIVPRKLNAYMSSVRRL